jgi:hypothetical protein
MADATDAAEATSSGGILDAEVTVPPTLGGPDGSALRTTV